MDEILHDHVPGTVAGIELFVQPDTSCAAATAPASAAQKIRVAIAGSESPPDPMMLRTSAPQSVGVTKKVATISVAIAEVTAASGSRSNVTNSAVGTFSVTAAAMPPLNSIANQVG